MSNQEKQILDTICGSSEDARWHKGESDTYLEEFVTDKRPCLTSFHASKIDIDKFAKELLRDCE